MNRSNAFLLHITINCELFQLIIVIIIRYIFYQRWCRKLWVQPYQAARAVLEKMPTLITSMRFEPPCLNFR